MYWQTFPFSGQEGVPVGIFGNSGFSGNPPEFRSEHATKSPSQSIHYLSPSLVRTIVVTRMMMMSTVIQTYRRCPIVLIRGRKRQQISRFVIVKTKKSTPPAKKGEPTQRRILHLPVIKNARIKKYNLRGSGDKNVTSKKGRPTKSETAKS